MRMSLHKNARTTPLIRAEIRASTESERLLAQRYGVSRQTIRKWRHREGVADLSHCPHRLNTTLTPEQELLVVELRTTLLLPVDDLLVVVREFINPNVSRSGLDRCLRRHGVSSLKTLYEKMEPDEKPKKKEFKDYQPGFVHVDIKYLPRMSDEEQRRYLYVGIDRATRWVWLEILPNKEAETAAGFLARLTGAAPFIISKVLTDNGKEFTDRFCATGERQATGKHIFDRCCAENSIEHRLTRPRTPQTNGMVERFNGRISELLATTRFDGSRSLEGTILAYQSLYNGHIPQRSLGHQTPLQALAHWQQKAPELFKSPANNLPGLDSLAFSIPDLSLG